MNFQVGDQVVHKIYGLGEIIQLDEKKLAGQAEKYYRVQIRDLTLWVPVSTASEGSLRFLTPASEFDDLFAILSSPGQPLADDRLVRKLQLVDQLKDGRLDSICRAVRDLTCHRRTKRMNENDKAVLERAVDFLLEEWAVALSISTAAAWKNLNYLLGEDIAKLRTPVNRNMLFPVRH